MLPVAEPLGQVDIQDVGQNGDQLGGVAQCSTDGVSWVNVVELCRKIHECLIEIFHLLRDVNHFKETQ